MSRVDTEQPHAGGERSKRDRALKKNPLKYSTIGDLRKLLRDLPPLDPEDAAEWQAQLRQIRAEARLPPSPWEDEAEAQ